MLDGKVVGNVHSEQVNSVVDKLRQCKVLKYGPRGERGDTLVGISLPSVLMAVNIMHLCTFDRHPNLTSSQPFAWNFFTTLDFKKQVGVVISCLTICIC